MTTTAPEHITLLAPDISCGHCVAAVEQTLSALHGVSQVQASAETKFVDVDFDPSQTSVSAINAALADAGYPAQQ